MRQLKRYGVLIVACVVLLTGLPAAFSHAQYSEAEADTVTAVEGTGTAGNAVAVADTADSSLTNKPMKFFLLDADNKPLTSDSAQFKLTNSITGGTVLNAKGAEKDSLTLQTSSSAPYIIIPTQKAGIYVLVEVKAPQGYQKLSEAITLVMSKNGAASVRLGANPLDGAALSGSDTVHYSHGFNVINQKAEGSAADEAAVNGGGGALPLVGTIGTFALAIFAGVFVVMAVLIFRTHRQSPVR